MGHFVQDMCPLARLLNRAMEGPREMAGGGGVFSLKRVIFGARMIIHDYCPGGGGGIRIFRARGLGRVSRDDWCFRVGILHLAWSMFGWLVCTS